MLGFLVTETSALRIALAAAAAAFAIAFGLTFPQQLLLLLIGWLAVLGLVRRLVSDVAPAGSADPILLVAPAAFVILAAAAARRGAFQRPTPLTNAVVVLSVLMIIGAVNPLQDSLLAGVSGLLFVFVPLLAFWIGRQLCNDELLARVFTLIATFAVLAAMYGLAQTLVGFPQWDETWIREFGYSALSVGGVTRAFSSFSAAAEYAYFLAIGLVIWIAFWFRPKRLLLTVPVVLLLTAAIILESSRGIVVLCALTTAVLLAARRGRGGGLRVILGLATVGGLFLLAGQAVQSTVGDARVATLTEHMIGGLTDPLSPEVSTLPDHASLLSGGLLEIGKYPLGQGVGRITIAAEKFGTENRATEADPSNVAVALGVPGLLAYLAVATLGFRRVYQVARVRRDALALVALGIATLTLFQWLNGGQYAVAFLPWLVLGWADRPLPDDTIPVGLTLAGQR